jgi:hypothetical protein
LIDHRADRQLKELGADSDRRCSRQVARVAQQTPLMLGLLGEHVDRLAEHLTDLHRQVGY